ncbi:MAG: rhomboid family intramembrane serine protease [Actinomycetota bacterium]
MIPIRDANPTRRTPWITLALIAANVLVFLVWQPTFGDPAEQRAFFYCNAEIPWEVSDRTNLASGGAEARQALDAEFGPGAGRDIQRFLQRECPEKSWLASVFVAMFLHGGWLHIAGNMLFLWVFGNNVEDRLGRLLFMGFYVLGGLAAMLLQLAVDASSTLPTVGASGAIAAVLGAYLVLFPRARVTTLVIFFFITWIDLSAWIVLAGWFVLQVFSGVGQLSTELSGGVAYWAHIGGFAFGAGSVWLFLRGRRRPRASLPPRPDYS